MLIVGCCMVLDGGVFIGGVLTPPATRPTPCLLTVGCGSGLGVPDTACDPDEGLSLVDGTWETESALGEVAGC
jgi:hypothetical protein